MDSLDDINELLKELVNGLDRIDKVIDTSGLVKGTKDDSK